MSKYDNQILTIALFHHPPDTCVWYIENVFTGKEESKQTRLCLREVKERPSNSPVSHHVLVRPGISADGSELCSSFPLSGSRRQHRTTPTWMVANSEASTQHRGRRDESQRSQLHQHHCKHAKVQPQRTAAGSKLKETDIHPKAVGERRNKRLRSRCFHCGIRAVVSALCRKRQ